MSSASTNRRNAYQAMALQDTAELLFIMDVNREIDILEGDLLKLFRGQPKRVDAFLETTRPRRKRSDPSVSTKGDSIGQEG
jgi:hypothetical protein